MAMTRRLPDDLDAKLTERARRERRSKQELAIEVIDEARNRAELNVDDVLVEFMNSDAEILDCLSPADACLPFASMDSQGIHAQAMLNCVRARQES
jgi:hypothetical protein